MIKTGVMMTGEMGFDDIFFSDNYDADIALWIIFIIFVLIMNIVLMNLLVSTYSLFCLKKEKRGEDKQKLVKPKRLGGENSVHGKVQLKGIRFLPLTRL